MVENASKSVSDVAVSNYDQLIEAMAATIGSILNKLVTLEVINHSDKQLISSEKSDKLQAEKLLDKFILNRIESGESEVFFTLLKVLNETGRCNNVVSKIYADLGKPPPPLSE